MPKPFLSLTMIVRDEEKTLGRVLSAAAQFCDERIVVDTGSVDSTVVLAESLGATVYHFPWINDFAAARNFALSKVTGDWVLWLDADDEVPDSSIEIFKLAKENVLPSSTLCCFMTPYNYALDESGGVVQTQYRERIARMASNPRWEGRVHEVCIVQGDLGVLPEAIVNHRPTKTHESKNERNLAIYATYTEAFSLRDVFQYARELRAADKYAEAIVYYERFLAEWQPGILDERYVCWIDLSECYRRLDNAEKCLESAGRAIWIAPTRAEAYGQMAQIYFASEYYQAAFVLFLAAAACQLPATSDIVYSSFYGKGNEDMVKLCKTKIDEAIAAQKSA